MSEQVFIEPQGAATETSVGGEGTHGPEAKEPLEAVLERLRSGNEQDRVSAAQELCRFAGEAVAPLCGALEDRSVEVRAEAARSLGEIGEDRAIQPLIEALRRQFVGRNATWNVVIAVLVVSAVVILCLSLVVGIVALKIGGTTWVFFNFGGRAIQKALERRRANRADCRAITEALERIAERSPTPELRAVLPDLKAMSLDLLSQDSSARAASRQAAERIEELTEKVKSMPIAARVPSPDAETLPRPGGAERE